MNKYCPNCKMNFSESFEECPYCEGELIIQDLNVSETIEPDILEMTDEELLGKYKDYLKSIRQQGCEITDKEFVNGLREGRKTQKDDERIANGTFYVPKCPTYGSPDVEKISLSSKVAGALFGLFSSNVRKAMHCRNCGYTW